MTTALARTRARILSVRWTDTRFVGACLLVTLALRLPFLTTPLGIDEGGYAYVASHWGSTDGALYGGQWVDRPPLLFALYAVAQFVADDLGIRVLGCLAAVVIVACCADTARCVGGGRALRWSALVATVLAASTISQATTVNAELPAVAFVSLGIWATTRALVVHRARHAAAFALLAGVAGMSAVLVKQSFVDAFAFAAVALVAFAIDARRLASAEARWARWRRVVTVATLGAAAALAVVAIVLVWATTRGPGIHQLLDALYGFRLEARGIIDGDAVAPRTREVFFVLLAAASGMLVLFAIVAFGLVRAAGGLDVGVARHERPARRAVAAGMVGAGIMALVGIVGGGNWWTHYLIQPTPFLAIGAGVVVAAPVQRRGLVIRASRRVASFVVVATLLIWCGSIGWAAVEGTQRSAASTGDWLRAAADPDDTAIVTWGHANVLERSGLRTPYRLAWSLPVRVLDPRLRELLGIMRGPDAPTWIVEWRPIGSWKLDPDHAVRDTVAERYERVATVCGKTIYRLREPESPTDVSSLPAPPTTCGSGRGLSIGAVRLF